VHGSGWRDTGFPYLFDKTAGSAIIMAADVARTSGRPSTKDAGT
jgi:hypothetical protein